MSPTAVSKTLLFISSCVSSKNLSANKWCLVELQSLLAIWRNTQPRYGVCTCGRTIKHLKQASSRMDEMIIYQLLTTARAIILSYRQCYTKGSSLAVPTSKIHRIVYFITSWFYSSNFNNFCWSVTGFELFVGKKKKIKS